MMFSHFFIDRPIFATVLSIVILIVGGVALLGLPIAQYPEVAPPMVQVSAIYPGANAKVVAETVATPIEQEVNGVENMLYMSSKCTNDGQVLPGRHVQARHRSEHGPGAGAEPRVDRRGQAARGSQAPGRDDEEEVAGHPAVRQPDLARQVATTSSILSATTRRSRSRTPWPACRASAT